MSDDVGILVCCGSRRGETRHASVVVFTFDFSPRGHATHLCRAWRTTIFFFSIFM
jgi:hypothetical protein